MNDEEKVSTEPMGLLEKIELVVLVVAVVALFTFAAFKPARSPSRIPRQDNNIRKVVSLNRDSTTPRRRHKKVSAEAESQIKPGQLKMVFTPDEEKKFNWWHDDITNMTLTALMNNDIEELERFLDWLREKDDWRKVKSVAEAMYLVKDWRKNVSEDAQDCIMDILTEYTPQTLPELLGFLESAYEDVREDALDEIADAIEESEDEKGMCSLISMLSDTVDNAEFAERMIEHMDMMDLTHDVSNAMMHILSKGTPAFKKALSDFLIEGEYAEKNDKTTLAYGVGKWLSERLAEEADD